MPRPLTLGGAALLVVIHFAATVVVYALVAGLRSGGEIDLLNLAATAVVAPLVALYVGLRRHCPEAPAAEALRVGRPRRRDLGPIGLAVVAGAALAPVAADVTVRIVARWPLPALGAERSGALGGAVEPSAVVLLVALAAQLLAAPFALELLFRGFIQPRLVSLAGAWRGIAMTAALFAAAHLEVRVFPVALLVGATLGLVAWRSGTTWAAAAGAAAHQTTPLLLAVAGAPLPRLGEEAVGFLPLPGLVGCLGLAGAACFVLWRTTPSPGR